MTWIWGIVAVISAIISVFGAVLVHLRAYDLQKRVENLEDRQQSIRSRVYAELGKSRDEVLQEVESYLQRREETSSGSESDIGKALLMSMLGGMQGQMLQPEPTREQAIDGLLGNGGNIESPDDSGE